MDEVLRRAVGITLEQGGKTIVALGLDPENLKRLEDLKIATMLSKNHMAFLPASRIVPGAASLSTGWLKK
jgi:hypothetical protein